MHSFANKTNTIDSFPIKDSKINFSFATKSKQSQLTSSSNLLNQSNRSRFQELKLIKKTHEDRVLQKIQQITDRMKTNQIKMSQFMEFRPIKSINLESKEN